MQPTSRMSDAAPRASRRPGAPVTLMVDVTSPLRVLLVEDNPGDVALVRELLEVAFRAGVEVREARTVAEAEAALAEWAPDVVLQDLGLPDAQGVAALSRVTSAAPDVPVVVLTGTAEQVFGPLAMHLGAQDYLVKGRVDDDVLARSIRYAVERKRADGRAREELRSSEARFRAVLTNVWDLVCVLDRFGSITYVTPSARRVLGVEQPDDLVGTSPVERIHPADRLRVIHAFRTWRAGQESVVSCRMRHADGSWRHLEVVGMDLQHEASVAGIVVTAHDVTEQVRAQEERSYQALHDPLTGLPNRALLVDRLEHALGRAARTDARAAVLFLDLDRFKLVNDTFGHAAGDDILIAVSELLSAVVRPGDTVARFGGDEFVVLCEDVDVAEAEVVAERLVAALARPFGVNSNQVHLGASVGIAITAAGHRTTGDELLRDADTALYRAKQEGRGRASTFDAELRLRTVRRALVEDALRHALERRQLHLHFQPQVALTDGHVHSFEVLLRWTHPQLGPVSPAEFIPIAEETGLIDEIGRWVLREGVLQAARWRHRHPEVEVVVSVNVSARQLAGARFPETVANALEFANLPARSLCLEITESTVMENADESVRTLRALKGLGVRLAIDDFGTGYSSLAYLKRFPIDELKVDRSFVAGLGSDPEDTVIVASVIHLARSLGLAVVAEGVETNEQLDHLASLGCDLGQGYLWARPQEAAAAEAMIGTTLQVPSARAVEEGRSEGSSTSSSEALAVVAHELRTPITVIRGFAETVAELVRSGHTDVLEDAMSTITRQANNMDLLVAALSDATAIEKSQLRIDRVPVELAAVVHSVVDDLSAVLANHTVAVSTAVRGPLVADPARLRQIVTNLLTNAAKFSPPGSAISVETREEGDDVAVRVVDSGPGVPFTRVGELFRKFSRLDSRVKGTGLGLYLSRELARAHGGDISYRRAPTGGSEFTVRLPRHATGHVAIPDPQPTSEPSVAASIGGDVLVATERAARRLVRAQTSEEVVHVLIRLVVELGGSLASEAAGFDALPLDVSLGIGDPLFVVAPRDGTARMRLEHVLPSFLDDCTDLVETLGARSRRRGDIDTTTAALTRRALSSSPEPAAGTSLLLVDVARGLATADQQRAIRALARTLAEVTDERHRIARWSPRRLVVIAGHTDACELERAGCAVRERWERHRPVLGPLAMGTATPDGTAPLAAVVAAAGRAVARRSSRPGPGAGD